MRVGIFDHMDCAHSVKALDGCHLNHGHTYKVEVVVSGELKDGIVIDFKSLREIARRAMNKYDHKDLSQFFDVPSCEIVAQALFADLKQELPGLLSVRCWEGYAKWAEANAEDHA